MADSVGESTEALILLDVSSETSETLQHWGASENMTASIRAVVVDDIDNPPSTSAKRANTNDNFSSGMFSRLASRIAVSGEGGDAVLPTAARGSRALLCHERSRSQFMCSACSKSPGSTM